MDYKSIMIIVLIVIILLVLFRPRRGDRIYIPEWQRERREYRREERREERREDTA